MDKLNKDLIINAMDCSFDNRIMSKESVIRATVDMCLSGDKSDLETGVQQIETMLNGIVSTCDSAITELNDRSPELKQKYIDYKISVEKRLAALTTVKPVDQQVDVVPDEIDISPKKNADRRKPKQTPSKPEKKIEFGEPDTEDTVDVAKSIKPLVEKTKQPSVKDVSDGITESELRNESSIGNVSVSSKEKEAIDMLENNTDLVRPEGLSSIPKPVVDDVESVIEEQPTTDQKTDFVSKPIVDDQSDEFEIESDEPKMIVIDDSDKTDNNSDEIDDEYFDANGYKSEGPIVNVDDVDLTEEQLAEVTIADKEDVDNHKQEIVDESINSIDKDKTLYDTSKVISRKRENPMFKTLSKLDIKKYDLGKVSIFDFNGEDEEFRKEYIISRNNMMAAPRVARVALLMSGHYEEISSYGTFDFSTISRKLSDSTMDFVDREVFLYNSIYSHIMYVSNLKSVPDFDAWAKNIYYPDLNSLFFGVYDANSVGVNNYTAECPACGKEMVIPRENKDLAVAVSALYGKKDLDEFITYKDMMKRDSSPLCKWASETIIRKQLNNTKYIVEYSVPTLYDYLTTIATMRKIAAQKQIDIDLASIETFDDPDTALRIFHYMYIKRIGVPSIVPGTNKIKFIGLNSKADIIEFLNALDVNDWSQLINDDDISEFITRSGVDFYIENAECNDPDCKFVIKHLLFNPKRAVFFKIGEVRASLR